MTECRIKSPCQIGKLANVKGLLHGFSLRSDGNMSYKYGEVMDVLSNRQAFLSKLQEQFNDFAKGLELQNLVLMKPEHKDGIVKVRDDLHKLQKYHKSRIVQCDALVTTKREVYLGLSSADCIPIIMYDPVKGVLALVHAGRRGVTVRLPEKMVQMLISRFQCNPEKLLVGFGPSIHAKSYVGYKSKTPVGLIEKWGKHIVHREKGELGFDTIGFALDQLLGVGVLGHNIHISPFDTGSVIDSKSKKLCFFSYGKSEQDDNIAEGRFFTIVGLVEK